MEFPKCLKDCPESGSNNRFGRYVLNFSKIVKLKNSLGVLCRWAAIQFWKTAKHRKNLTVRFVCETVLWVLQLCKPALARTALSQPPPPPHMTVNLICVLRKVNCCHRSPL